jgi:hypothetical protein
MLLALKRFAKLALIPILLGAVLPAGSESQAQRLVANATSPSSPLPASLDPAGDALLTLGSDGKAIRQARAEVLALLFEPNSCSAWFQAAEPQVFEKFRSLEFAVDGAGARDILKLAAWREDDGYYQPYVARTGQNVGWGSTVTLNENGAFFKKMAPVRVVTSFDDKGYFKSSRSLSIGNYEGATLPARILALLHELGHVVNLLPIDSGVPSGPAISVQNTEKVLRQCGAQIHAHRKPSRETNSAATLTAATPQFQDPFAAKPKTRGASLQ